MGEPKFKVGDTVRVKDKLRNALGDRRDGKVTGIRSKDGHTRSWGDYYYITDGECGHSGTWENDLEKVE